MNAISLLVRAPKQGCFLAATPIDVSQVLRARLFEQFDSIVLTSATLTVAGTLEYIRHRLGLDPR